ncbi:MAG TPA: sulfatase [Candidatus Lokiarchaeia archaeon]|nr:sulfatase [Candidatus Lokiarchaeia archaeon]
MIIIDSLRKDHLGCYGNSWIKTPNIDRLASESLRFTNAFPECLPTIPVRRAIHTGIRTFGDRHYVRKKGDPVAAFGWAPVPEDQSTLAEYLLAAGYRTAFFSDTYHQFKPSMNFTRGFNQWTFIRGQENDPYKTGPPIDDDAIFDEILPEDSSYLQMAGFLERYLINVQERASERDYFPARVFSAATDWLKDNRDARKFFLCIDSFDPHEPWDPPESYRNLYLSPGYAGKKPITTKYGQMNYLTPGELEYMRAGYAGEVTLVDAWFGHFMNALKDLGLDANTAIVFISDHGHQIGDKHDLSGKVPWGLYPELVDIPFMLHVPDDRMAGESHGGLVQDHEILPTILGMLGLKIPEVAQGRDLAPLLDGATIPELDHVSCGFNEFVLVRTTRHAYIADFHFEREKLYDLDADPDQLVDVSGQNPDICEKMREYALADAGGEMIDYQETMGKRSQDWYNM